MTVELGQTTDPRHLIPGQPAAVRDLAANYRRDGDAMYMAGTGLKDLGTADGWDGTAADSFRAVFHGQPDKWITAADAFHAAADAIDTYVPTLEWAQQRAEDAIALYASGKPHEQAACDMLTDARDQLASAGSAAAVIVGRARDLAPPKPGFFASLADDIGGFLSGAGHVAKTVGVTAVNDVASLADAAINDPGSLAQTIAGLGLTVVSAGGEVGGLALDATGVGGVLGVPAGAVSTAGITAGLSLAGTGVSTIVRDTAGHDRLTVMDARAKPGSGDPDWKPPQRITGTSKHGDEMAHGIRDGHGVSDEAMQDAVEHPKRTEKADKGRTKFTGKDAVVVAAPDGTVVTTWARNARGWRYR